MKLGDCKVGDKVIVYLGRHGHLEQNKTNGLDLETTIVARTWASTGSGARTFLGWDATSSIVPNGTEKNRWGHRSALNLGLADLAMSNFEAKYHWILWVPSDYECQLVQGTPAIKASKHYQDQCPCGIHPNQCSYHRGL